MDLPDRELQRTTYRMHLSRENNVFVPRPGAARCAQPNPGTKYTSYLLTTPQPPKYSHIEVAAVAILSNGKDAFCTVWQKNYRAYRNLTWSTGVD